MVQSWSRWQTEFTLVTNELPSATIGLFPAIISEDKLLLADSDAAATELSCFRWARKESYFENIHLYAFKYW